MKPRQPARLRDKVPNPAKYSQDEDRHTVKLRQRRSFFDLLIFSNGKKGTRHGKKTVYL